MRRILIAAFMFVSIAADAGSIARIPVEKNSPQAKFFQVTGNKLGEKILVTVTVSKLEFETVKTITLLLAEENSEKALTLESGSEKDGVYKVTFLIEAKAVNKYQLSVFASGPFGNDYRILLGTFLAEE